MNLSMQPRVPQTGGFPFSLIVFSLIIAFLYFYRVVFFPSAMPLLSSFFFFFIFSYAIKKKDEIERVAKANR
jgi:uncharacterized protein YacL